MSLRLAVVVIGVIVSGTSGADEPGTSGTAGQTIDGNPGGAEAARGSLKGPQQRTGPMSVTITPYYDSRDFLTLNLTTFSARLPSGFNVWGFIDLHGDHDAGEERFDLSRYFVEYRLRWQAPGRWRSLGLEAELNDSPGQDNGLLRFGVTYRVALPFLAGSWAQVRALPVQTRGESSQLSLIHYLELPHRLSLSGFTDLNIPWNGNTPRFVTETQLTWHFTSYLGAAVEARYNGFEDAAPGIDGFGIAGGLEMTF